MKVERGTVVEQSEEEREVPKAGDNADNDG